MPGISFLSPLFLAGVAAAAIPIVIHLMQRRKAKVQPFGTLRFLREIQARLSMRQRIRELLLLALRVALIALLALAMARPVLKGAGLGDEDAPVTMVFVVDNSLSMSAQVGGVSNFERARDLLSSNLADMKNSDRMAVIPLVTGSITGDVVYNKALPPGDLLERSIAELRQGYATGDPGAAVKKALAILSSADTPNLELYLLSDFQKATWEGFSLPADAVPEDLRDRLVLYTVDFTAEELRNAAVRNPSVKRSPAGSSLLFAADVVNFSREAFDVRLALSCDGRKVAEKLVPLAPEEKRRVEAEVALPQGAFHRITASIEGDDMQADNAFNLAWFAPPALDVLLVDGEPSSVPTLDAVYYLRCALDPGWKRGRLGLMGMKTRVVKLSDFGSSSLGDADVVFLAGVPQLSPTVRDRLFAFVRAGGGLIVVPGPKSSEGDFTRSFTLPGGAMPLPVFMKGITPQREGQQYFLNFSSLSLLHPLWAGIPERALQVLCNEPFSAVAHLEENPSASARDVAAAFENGWPAIVSASVGMGNVVVLGFSLSRRWSSLPLKPVFPLLCHRLTRFAAGTLAGLRKTVEVGKPVTVFLKKRPGDARFKVDYPSGTVELAPVLGEDGFYLNAPPSPDPGFIFFHPLPAAGFDGYLTAVNPPPAESEPSFLEADEIASAVGVPSAFHVGDPGRLAEVRTRLKSGVPIGGWFFLLALLVLAAESILANDVAARIMAGRKAEASTLGPLSRKAIMSLRRRRKRKKEAV